MEPLLAKIVCPRCGAELDAAAEACRRCGAPTGAPPAGSSADRTSSASRPLLERPWMLTIVVLHLGLFGIPLYWRTGYSRSTRMLIVAASIVYTIGVAAVLVWGIGQIWKAVQLLS